MPIKLDPKDGQLLITATELLNQRSFKQAQQLLNDRTQEGLTIDNPAGLMLLAEIAGLLIDIGSEGRIEQAINDGLLLLESNHRHLDGFMTTASLHYNFGNAKSALVELRNPHPFASPGLADYELLLKAKNHYWKAFKTHDGRDTFAHNLQTNLGNTLRKSGRITEALTAYDNTITADPEFAMARFHRGLALLSLEQLSGTSTANLLQQIAHEYKLTADTIDLPQAVREIAGTMRHSAISRLNGLGYDNEQLAHELQETAGKASAHTPYRLFTLQHHLGLSEHSLYCQCAGARRDDLMIATAGNPVTGDKIPRLELIVNRLKAEFGTARLLYYKAIIDDTTEYYEQDITFTELYEGEEIGIRTELLRTSFRLCLGILDKIALGICELSDVADQEEKLYFESFWTPTSKKGKASTRWHALNAKSTNPSLVALYSQATDLRSDGEWALFKAWRNDLEHQFLILTQTAAPPDGWNARAGTFSTRCVTIKEFRDRTLHLLQFTRGAIFNFTFCIRHETQSPDDGTSITLTLNHKHAEPDRQGD